ncbi:alcohol dehydrogenase zinc-binding domain protein [Hyaloscypha sp. PMI_1271]|nr:alcohol dehydrogenase zinc-binding domain protein [Hyaloscypha sp. PMI_1271]
MKAIFLSTPGKPSTYVFKDIPIPEALPGRAVIKVKAFGLNHAEVHMRKGEWPEIHEISAIECVGIVHSCAENKFAVGTKVAALMGRMGRTIPGSYAEYTRVRVGNVVSIETDLSCEELAAIPESGGTSSLGHAAVNLAVNAGARVTATTRNLDRAAILKDLGVHEVVLEGPELSKRLPYKGFDTVLDLVGNSVVMDSLEIFHRGGRVCIAGWLGGLAPIKEFNPLLQMPTGVHLSFFGSPHFGMSGIEVSDVPMQKIAEDVAKGRYKAKRSQVFRFEDISKAHEALEHGSGNGKIVVKVSK